MGDETTSRRGARVAVPTIAVAIVVGAIVLVLGTREPAANRIADSPLVGQPAPALSGTTLDGATYDLTADRGRFVLVNFFASWCVPCVQEHDDLIRFAERQAWTGDATVVSVAFDDSTESVRAFFDTHGGDWPVIVGDDGDIPLDFGVAKVPESYLIDPDGFVVAKIIGGVTDDGLESLLERHQEAAG